MATTLGISVPRSLSAHERLCRNRRGREADAHRALSQWKRRVALVQKAEEDLAVTAARLANRLNLDPSVRLEPIGGPLVPLNLVRSGHASARAAPSRPAPTARYRSPVSRHRRSRGSLQTGNRPAAACPRSGWDSAAALSAAAAISLRRSWAISPAGRISTSASTGPC